MSEISCDEVLRELELYLDGELPAERAEHLAEHLCGCGLCLDHAEFHRRLRLVIRTKCRTESPHHLVERIRVALRSERHAPED